MIRYDLEFAPSIVGSDSEMVARADGDWVLYVSHLAEVHQTQRRMIAALYWRAGEHRAESERATHAAPECMETASGVLEYALSEHRNHMTMWCVAQNMEAACPR